LGRSVPGSSATRKLGVFALKLTQNAHPADVRHTLSNQSNADFTDECSRLQPGGEWLTWLYRASGPQNRTINLVDRCAAGHGHCNLEFLSKHTDYLNNSDSRVPVGMTTPVASNRRGDRTPRQPPPGVPKVMSSIRRPITSLQKIVSPAASIFWTRSICLLRTPALQTRVQRRISHVSTESQIQANRENGVNKRRPCFCPT